MNVSNGILNNETEIETEIKTLLKLVRSEKSHKRCNVHRMKMHLTLMTEKPVL